MMDHSIQKFLIIAKFILGLALLLMTANVSTAAEQVDIPVPKNIIYAGQLLKPELLRSRSVPSSYVQRVSIYKHDEQLIGKVARKTLLPNRPIFTNTVIEPDVVEVNRITMMRYAQGGLRITTEVNPLNSAKVGQAVRARNIRTGIIVHGIASSDGTIEVSGVQ